MSIIIITKKQQNNSFSPEYIIYDKDYFLFNFCYLSFIFITESLGNIYRIIILYGGLCVIIMDVSFTDPSIVEVYIYSLGMKG